MEMNQIQEQVMEQLLQEKLKAQNQQVSQPNANTNVVGSLFQSREVKFRAWLIPDDDFESELPYMTYDLAFEDYAPVNEQLKSVSTLMQYTGLKDKNGKEIWESDLCRVAHNGLCQIFWDEKRARFGVRWLDKTFKSIRGDVEMIFNNHEIVFEVVGNIFENPELLETLR